MLCPDITENYVIILGQCFPFPQFRNFDTFAPRYLVWLMYKLYHNVSITLPAIKYEYFTGENR
jgi:hypothetical protein